MIGFAEAQECTVARPYFGSISCEEGDGWSQPISLTDGQTWTCDVPNCEINNYKDFGEGACGYYLGSKGLKITDSDGNPILDCSTNTFGGQTLDCRGSSFPRSLHAGDIINIDFWCNPTVGRKHNPQKESTVLVSYKPIYLKTRVDSAEVFKKETEFCNVNELWDKYKSEQLPNNNYLEDLQIEEITFTKNNDIPISSGIIGSQPKQLEIDEGIWFVYDWVERPALITSLFKGKQVWCNPIDHSLTELEEVSTIGNDCYLIPTTKLGETVECCSSSECKGQYSNQEVLCTDDFKCGFEKSCNSDFDCGATETCEEDNGKYYAVNSYCDKSKLDSYEKGFCESKKEEVKCCSETCGSGEFCDYEVGCKEVSYLGSEGQIKTGVQGENIEGDSADITGSVIGAGGSSKGGIILAIFVILIAGSIGYFVYTRRQASVPVQQPVTKPAGGFCTKCGTTLGAGATFCNKCGRKVYK